MNERPTGQQLITVTAKIGTKISAFYCVYSFSKSTNGYLNVEGILTLSKHDTHYSPRSRFPYNQLTTPLSRKDSYSSHGLSHSTIKSRYLIQSSPRVSVTNFNRYLTVGLEPKLFKTFGAQKARSKISIDKSRFSKSEGWENQFSK